MNTHIPHEQEEITRINRTSYVADLNKLRDYDKLTLKVSTLEALNASLKAALTESQHNFESIKSKRLLFADSAICRDMTSMALCLAELYMDNLCSGKNDSLVSGLRVLLEDLSNTRTPEILHTSQVKWASEVMWLMDDTLRPGNSYNKKKVDLYGDPRINWNCGYNNLE